MQWGQNSTSTASSNAVFFVDAWLNFGLLGIIFYAGFFAVAIKLIIASRFPPLIAAAVVPAYTACFVALPAVFLSGGLAVFVLLAILTRQRVDETVAVRRATDAKVL